MIVIKGRSQKSLKIAEYINNNIGKDKRIVIFDSVQAPYLPFQIKRDYDHFTFTHSFEELLEDLSNESAEETIENADVIIFECNISPEELGKIDEERYSQQIIVTVQTEESLKICDTKNI